MFRNRIPEVANEDIRLAANLFAYLEALPSHIHEFLTLRSRLADDEHATRISIVAIQNRRAIHIDDVALFEDVVLAGNAVTHHIVDAEAGKTVEFEKVLLVDNEGAITVGAPTVEGAKVVAEINSPLVKGEKVLIFHKKRRKGYRKLNGHRQQFTELTIKEVIA